MSNINRGRKPPLEKTMTNEERFIEAALTCLLWSERDWGEEEGDSDHSLFDAGYTIKDIYLDDRSDFAADCRRFMRAVNDVADIKFTDYEQAGHDFTLSINEHGAGFFDSPELYGGRKNVWLLMACARCIPSATPWTRGGVIHLGRGW